MSGRPYVWLTCADDLRSHAVWMETIAAATEPMADGIPAVAGHRIMLRPRVLARPPGPRCPTCAAGLAPDAEDRTPDAGPLAMAYELLPHAFAHPPHTPDGHLAHAMALVTRRPRRRWWPLGIARRHRGDSP